MTSKPIKFGWQLQSHHLLSVGCSTGQIRGSSMADIQVRKGRTSVVIQLQPADIMAMLRQPEVISSFGKAELEEIVNLLEQELKTRGEEHGIDR